MMMREGEFTFTVFACGGGGKVHQWYPYHSMVPIVGKNNVVGVEYTTNASIKYMYVHKVV
jgi:hypothetical protein